MDKTKANRIFLIVLVFYIFSFFGMIGIQHYLERYSIISQKKTTAYQLEIFFFNRISDHLHYFHDKSIEDITNLGNGSIQNLPNNPHLDSLDNIISHFHKSLQNRQIEEEFKGQNIALLGKINYQILDSLNIQEIIKTNKELKKTYNDIDKNNAKQKVAETKNKYIKLLRSIIDKRKESEQKLMYNYAKLHKDIYRINRIRDIILITFFGITVYLILRAKKQIIHMLNIQKKYENELHATNQNINQILQKLPVGVVMLDKEDGIIIDANITARKLLYIAPDANITGQSCKDFVDCMKMEYCKIGNPQTEQEVSFQRSDGTRVQVLMSKFDTQIGSQRISLIAFMDITERVISKQKLREQQKYTQNIINSAPVGIAVIDPYKKKIVDINRKALEMFNTNRKEIFGGSCENLICSSKGQNCIYRDLKAPVLNQQIRIKKENGQSLVLLKSIVPLQYDKKDCLVEAFIDITAQYQNKKELEEAKEAVDLYNEELQKAIQHANEFAQKAAIANEAKTQFLSNMSHELRTPMHGILSYSRFGIRKIEKVPRKKLLHYFQQINVSGDRLMELLNDLLDLSKLVSGKMSYEPELQSILPVIESIYSEFKMALIEKDVELILPEVKDEIKILFDKKRLAQVLSNLISNAIKFTAKGSTITIKASTSSFEKDGEKIDSYMVSVSDQGVGIPENELESVFDKFIQSSKTRTGAGGTGLGLAICKEVVDTHGGIIYAFNNQEQDGATFVFHLPLDIEYVKKHIIDRKLQAA